MLPCHFRFFHFFNFNMNIVKYFMKNVSILRRIFKGCLKFFYVTQSFKTRNFWHLNDDLFNIFGNLSESFFFCLIFGFTYLCSMLLRAIGHCKLNNCRLFAKHGPLKMGVCHFSNFSFSLWYNFCRKSYEKTPFMRWIFKNDSEMAALKYLTKS